MYDFQNTVNIMKNYCAFGHIPFFLPLLHKILFIVILNVCFKLYTSRSPAEFRQHLDAEWQAHNWPDQV